MKNLNMLIGEIQNRNQLHFLINMLDLKTGVEVGVQMGGYSKYLLQNTNMFMYLVDPWVWIPGYDDVSNVEDWVQEDRLQITKNALASYVDRYKIIRKFSVDAAKEFKYLSLDFIYIDANHDYKHVREDLISWYTKIRTGGLIAGHDFLDSGENFGVRKAVLEFAGKACHKVYSTYEDWPSWYFIKEYNYDNSVYASR